VKITTNTIAMLVGLFVLLSGLLFVALDPTIYALVAVPLTGVGGSILATGLTGWLIARQFSKIDVNSIVQALVENTSFVRNDHSLELTFSLEDNGIVKVQGEHCFTLVNNRNSRARKFFKIYTDLGCWNELGGFESVVEPSGQVLQGAALVPFVSELNGKYYFIKSYDINKYSSSTFRFITFGYYRRIDRLIWTVQDLSTDFHVKLVNSTGVRNAFLIKINHHRERDIIASVTKIPELRGDEEEIILEFGAVVLPYQGFEVMWNLDDPARTMASGTPIRHEA
jgi:hypothetical protein